METPENPTHFDIFSILQSAIPGVKVDVYTVMAFVIGVSIMLMAFDYITTVLLRYDSDSSSRDLKKIGRKIRKSDLQVERSSGRTQKTDFSDWDEEEDEIEGLSVDWEYGKDKE